MNLLFDRDIIDGRGLMCSALAPTVGDNQGMGDVGYGKIYDIDFPPEFLPPWVARPATSWTWRT